MLGGNTDIKNVCEYFLITLENCDRTLSEGSCIQHCKSSVQISLKRLEKIIEGNVLNVK